MEIKDIVLAIIAALDLLLVGVILFDNPKKRINIFYSLMTFAVASWTFGIIMFRSSVFDASLFWAIFYYISAALIATYFLYFVIAFPCEGKKWSIKYHLLMHIPIIMVSFLLIFNLKFFDEFTLRSWGKEIKLGLAYYFYVFYFVGYMSTAFIILLRKIFKAKGEEKFQLKFVFLGTFIGTIFAAFFNLILPIYNYKFIWVGPCFALIMIASLTYSILRHHLFNIKVIATELLTFAVWIAILVEVFLADTWKERALEGGLLIFVVFFGILIIRSVIKEVAMREEVEKLALDLKSANDKLKEMDQIKSDFVTIASHQLWSPLTAIKGYASLMLEGSYGKVPEKMKDPLSKLFRSSERMVVMVGDFLNVSRIERGKIDYEFTKFDLKKIVKELFEEFKLSMEKEGRSDPKLYFDTEVKGEVFVNGDEGKIKQVLSNLIDNAIKYTPVREVGLSVGEVGKISGFVKIIFSLPKDKQVALVAVKDSGAGMSEETLGKLFDKFSRAGNASKFNANGSGLGLYVAKEFMKKHDGRIWAESAGEGKGSTFFVELPLGK